jgi:sugar phosphate permease
MSNTDWSEPFKRLYRQRWRIWVVAVLAHTIGMFHRAAMAPIADRVMADLELTAVAFGSLGAVYFYTYAAMQVPSGTLADTLGPRKTIVAGLLLSALGSLVMSTANSFSVMFLGRLLISFGASVPALSALKLLMGWFRPREMATMTGLTVSLASLGQIAGATPLALLVMWIGWRMSFTAMAGISLVMAAITWFIVKDSPAHVGLPSVAELDHQTALPDVAGHHSPHLSLAQRFAAVFTDRRLWPLFLVGFGTYGAYATLFHNWMVIYLMQTYDVQRDFAANFVLIAAIGMIVGAPVVGFLSDRLLQQRRLPMALFASFSLASFLILALWNGARPPLVAIYPLCFLVGLGCGASPVAVACVRDTVQPAVRGIASGLVNSGGFVGAAIAQPLFGHLLDLKWTGGIIRGTHIYPLEAFQQGFLLCCVLAALGCVATLLVREPGRLTSIPHPPIDTDLQTAK